MDHETPEDRYVKGLERLYKEHRASVRFELVEGVRAVIPRLDHWPREAVGAGWNRDTEPHSEMCPPCALLALIHGD
jgi:hypothetical protein